MDSWNFKGKMIKKQYRIPENDVWDIVGHQEDEYIAPQDLFQICNMEIQNVDERKQILQDALDGDIGEYLSRYYSTLSDGSYPEYKQLPEYLRTLKERRTEFRIKKSDSDETKQYKIQQRELINQEISKIKAQLQDVNLKFYDVNLKKTDTHGNNISAALERWGSFLLYADDERKETEELTYTQRGLNKAESRTAELDNNIYSTFEILDVDGKVDYHDTATISYLLATNPNDIRDVRLVDIMMDFQSFVERAGLTERENKVYHCLSNGNSQKEVAEFLKTSKQNISKIVKNIVKKIKNMVD